MSNANIGSDPSRTAPCPYASTIVELITNGSVELCDSGDSIPALREILPFQKSIFVPATKKRPLPLLLESLRKLHDTGFDPVPHIAARRITSTREIETFLKNAARSCGVHRVLLIGGDVSRPIGPYESAYALLKEGILQDAGITEIGFAGYPDGHPHISQSHIDAALQAKLSLARDNNMGASIITQFSFVPRRIVDYCSSMAKVAPQVPIYVGIPGPCNPIKLLKYARICGVSASAKMLGDMGFKAVKLAIHSDLDEQLQVVARGVAVQNLDNVVGVHIFSFGDIFRSAKWLESYVNRLR